MTNRMVYQSVSGQTIAPCPAQLLITSFDTWLPHQRSNAADDLIQQAIDRQDFPPDVLLLRHLPVENTTARDLVSDYIDRFRPRVVLCCGMAESRSRLSLEQQATLNGQTLQTTITLKAWCDRLAVTDLSDDAGQFVCNYLYYQVLDHPYSARQALAEVREPDPRHSDTAPGGNPLTIPRLNDPPSMPPQFHHAVFLHVPPLTTTNRHDTAQDFAAIVKACLALSPTPPSSSQSSICSTGDR